MCEYVSHKVSTKLTPLMKKIGNVSCQSLLSLRFRDHQSSRKKNKTKTLKQ